MTTTNYNIRLDQELRDRAFSVFESYGLTPSQAIKLFLNQVAETNTVPLSFDYHSKPSNSALQAVTSLEGSNHAESTLEG
ncbi:type II toxin-antitoxin system RelB/DinJ family antitoxin [Psychrobacter sp. GP33]|uniref:type II toxin-antitoxin system RelB/DinJ family antitoxin n=1 Tax=Psychrobacter sp. GP33 TaxID=2758709 RepID=UPI0015F83768|nr:type II toxin-antitoxin system RelB/DinJ family antitoxin [Psychrobacter sp. GP33]